MVSDEKKFHTAQGENPLSPVCIHMEPDQKLGKIMRTVIGSSIKVFQEQMQQVFQSQRVNFKIPNLDPIRINSFEIQIENLKPQMEALFEGVRRSFRNLPPKLEESLILLGKHGWFLDDDMDIPWLWRVSALLQDRKLMDAEKLLVSHFGRRVDAIESSIIERFPDRSVLIHSAFNAHRRQEYALSILALLAQADGICKEVSDKFLYNKERNSDKAQVASYVDKIVTSEFSKAILSPLATRLPISKSWNERDEGFSELNRHMIMHGVSLDYGNSVNGLKAISLINYIAHTLKDAAKNKT